MWWMTVPADGYRDYRVKRISSVLLPSVQYWDSTGIKINSCNMTEYQREIIVIKM